MVCLERLHVRFFGALLAPAQLLIIHDTVTPGNDSLALSYVVEGSAMHRAALEPAAHPDEKATVML